MLISKKKKKKKKKKKNGNSPLMGVEIVGEMKIIDANRIEFTPKK